MKIKLFSAHFLLMSLIAMLISPGLANADPWSEAGTYVYTTDPTKYVGIGTSQPKSKLQLYDASVVQFRVDGYNGTYGFYLGADQNSPWFGTRTSHDLRFVAGSVEKARLTKDGKFGIGTNSSTLPKQKFHIYNGNAQISSTNSRFILHDSDSGGYWHLRQDGDAFYIERDKDKNGNFTNVDKAFFISTNGYVGIGTTTPVSKFHVSGGDLTLDDSKKLILGGSDSGEWIERTCGTLCSINFYGGFKNRMIIGNNGNIGIEEGDGIPDSKFEVNESDANDFAVVGQSWASTGNGAGIYGITGANGKGSGSPAGVYGWAYYDGEGGDTFGVLGRTSTKGGFDSAYDSTAAALYGEAVAPSGFSMGAWGETFSSSSGASGVRGVANVTTGVVYGVHGQTHSSKGFGVYSAGPTGATGYKSAIVYTEQQGPTELYAVEATGVYFEDLGMSQLNNGKAIIQLDPLFLETVTINEENPLQIFVQPYDDVQLYVKPGHDSFEVLTMGQKPSNASFAYRIVAKRKFHEQRRLGKTEAEIDMFMRPDLSDQELRDLNLRWGFRYDNGIERRDRATYNYAHPPQQE